jgi:hypothetical protein
MTCDIRATVRSEAVKLSRRLRSRRALSLTCGLALLTSATPAAAATYTLTPSQDTYIDIDNPNANFGGQTLMQLKGAAVDDDLGLVQFAGGALPFDEVLTGATLHLTIQNAGQLPATLNYTVHRVTSSWTELGATWTTRPSFDSAATASAGGAPGATLSFNVTNLVRQWLSGTANHGFLINSSQQDTTRMHAREELNTALRPRLVVTTTEIPVFNASLSATVVSDPLSGTVEPKRIPGAIIASAAVLTNQGRGTAQSVSLVIPVSPNTRLFVGDLGIAGSGPVTFTQGTQTSGVTYTYSGFASTTDDVEFSSDGTNYTYTPTPSADGYDSLVRSVRLVPKGTFAGSTAMGLHQLPR